MSGIINGSKFNMPIVHRNWQRAISEIFAIISCASPGEVVCLTGPSRVGKSTLINRVNSMLFGEDDFERTGKLNSIRVTASNSGNHGAFSTKAMIQRMLKSVKHPLYSVNGLDLQNYLAIQKFDRTTESTLREALEQAIIARGVKIIFIDEAQHIKYVSKDAQAPLAVMESWKCLAENTNTIIVFIGAYPILDILSNAAHLLGRKHQIHFPRYHVNAEDIVAFGQILQKYSELITFNSSLQSLTDVAELLYEGSFGCIGLLKGWLNRADAISLHCDTPFNEKLLYRTRLSDLDLSVIRKEILTGEKMLQTKKSDLSGVGESEDSRSDSRPTIKKGKPFHKKPKREVAGNRLGGE
ncbi:ATP-binding protein [Cellvibrio sp. OA-2007]|uniref:ATP-binding protein n=1 Tax=Cellvibrio sp. OA-2007 TaxID=529823 RepID=UPI000786137C|nr:ATP-binding protein [Cellvibrio sp. OA-2007]